MNDLEDTITLARGLRAQRQLGIHAVVSMRATNPQECTPCTQFAVVLMRGGDPADHLSLRCEQAQQWHREVDAAFLVAERILGDQ